MKDNHNVVGWFEIYVQDMQRAKAFYEATFKVQLSNLGMPNLEMWAFPMHHQKPGSTGALVKMEGKDSGVGGVLIYFVCETDCAVEASLAVKNGGQLVKEKFSIGEHGFIALVKDTEGNMIGLHSMK
jgi:predicted enzyme related to lactoylglutathione lyase